MKQVLLVAAVMFLCAATLRAEEEKVSGTFVVVRVYDWAGESTVEVLSSEEAKQLESNIKEEARFATKAMQEAQKEWSKNEDHKGKSFPRAAIKDRKVDKLGTYTDREKASKKADSYQKDPPKEDDKKKTGRTKSKEDIAKEAQKKAERDSLMSEARGLFEEKLKELAGAAKAGGEEKKEAKQD